MAKKGKHKHQHDEEGATLTSEPAAGLNGHSAQRKPMRSCRSLDPAGMSR